MLVPLPRPLLLMCISDAVGGCGRDGLVSADLLVPRWLHVRLRWGKDDPTRGAGAPVKRYRSAAVRAGRVERSMRAAFRSADPGRCRARWWRARQAGDRVLPVGFVRPRECAGLRRLEERRVLEDRHRRSPVGEGPGRGRRPCRSRPSLGSRGHGIRLAMSAVDDAQSADRGGDSGEAAQGRSRMSDGTGTVPTRSRSRRERVERAFGLGVAEDATAWRPLGRPADPAVTHAPDTGGES